MPTTGTRIQLGLYTLEIQHDGTPAASDIQPFAKVADLRTGTATTRPFASFEPDYWLLNGNYKFLPADTSTVHVGYVSLSMSNSNGAFDTPPALTVTFGDAHSIPDLVLHFGEQTGDYCSDIDVAFYDAADALIRSDNYMPDGAVFSTGQAVEDFKKLTITFNATNRPYRYVRLTAIDYGSLLTLDAAIIKAAGAVEEVDQISSQVRIGTVDMRLHSDDAQFSIMNPVGYYAALAERQPLWVFEQVDNEQVFIGQYYLDEWSNDSETEIEFRCVDRLGVLDKQTCRGGIWTGAGIAVETLIANLLSGVAPYELDPTLNGIMVIGWLPVCSYREALQQIAFAVGASVTCARSGAVVIRKTKLASVETATATITRAMQLRGGGLSLLPLITGAEVTAHNFIASSTSQSLYNGALAAGTHEIKFSQPMHDLSVAGATIVESGANYAILSVASPGVVTLSGQTYIETTQTAGVYAAETTGLVHNVVEVTDATLVHAGNVAAVAQRVYDYHQQRYRKKLTLIAPVVTVGDVVIVDTLYGGQVRGVIEKMESNLTGGFLAKCEVTGVNHDG